MRSILARGTSAGRSRVPVPALVALALLLPFGPAGLLLGGGDATPSPSGNHLARIAEGAGCRLTESKTT